MGTITPSTEYSGLRDRLAKLAQRKAVLEAEESRKRDMREKLRADLVTAGVDPENLGAERERLTQELADLQTQAIAAIDDFEARLNVAENGIPEAGKSIVNWKPEEQSPEGTVEID